MNTLYGKILITLFVSALPVMSIAADNTPVQAAPAATQKSPVTATQLPVRQPTTPAMAAAPIAQPTVLIGYVDPIRVSTDSEPGKAGQVKLMEKKDKLQAQIETKRKQLEKQQAAIEAKLPSLSPKQREAKSKEFGKKVEEFQKFGQGAERQLQELQQELSGTLYRKIEQAAVEYGKSNGFMAVFVKRDLLYSASGVDVRDVTDDVVKLINEKDSKK